jgi:hypothetical protein
MHLIQRRLKQRSYSGPPRKTTADQDAGETWTSQTIDVIGLFVRARARRLSVLSGARVQ